MPRKKGVKPHGKGRAASRAKSPKKAPKKAATKAVKKRSKVVAPAPAPVAHMPARTRRFGRAKDVRDMDRPELEAYAMEIGMMRRALTLTDDRLRQNIQAFLAETME
jgi:hypothetical protein